MIDPTASLSIDRTGLSLAVLTFSGVDDLEPFGLVDMGKPAMIARVYYADTSRYVAGGLPTSAVWERTNLPAVVKLTGTTAAELADREAQLRAALGQFSYSVTQTINGVATVFSATMGNLAPVGDLRYEDLRRLWQAYTLTIPVQPLEA